MWRQTKLISAHPRLRQHLIGLLLAGLCLTSCTFTISPLGDISVQREQRQSPTAPPVATATAQAPSTPDAPDVEPEVTPSAGSQSPSIIHTIGWRIVGKAANKAPLTLDIPVDYEIPSPLLDTSFYQLGTRSGPLVTQLMAYGIQPEDVRLDYALINRAPITPTTAMTATTKEWTLYHLQPLTTIVTPTHVVPYSTIQTGLPYIVTTTVPLIGESAATASLCAASLHAGISCLLQQVRGLPGSEELLSHRPAFLLLSTKNAAEPQHILVWFWITPGGIPISPPDGSGSICQFCTTVCSGDWCGWICRAVRC